MFKSLQVLRETNKIAGIYWKCTRQKAKESVWHPWESLTFWLHLIRDCVNQCTYTHLYTFGWRNLPKAEKKTEIVSSSISSHKHVHVLNMIKACRPHKHTHIHSLLSLPSICSKYAAHWFIHTVTLLLCWDQRYAVFRCALPFFMTLSCQCYLLQTYTQTHTEHPHKFTLPQTHAYAY